MENRNSVSRWGQIRSHIIVWALLVMIALAMSMCGTRNSNLNKKSETLKTDETIANQGTTKKQESNTNQTTNKERNSKKDENIVEKTEKVYNENGTIQKETTTKETKRSQEKSSKTVIITITQYRMVDSTFYTYVHKTVNHNVSDKSKTTTADKSFVANVGGWGVVIAIVVIIAGALFAWAYFKPKIPGLKNKKGGA